MKINQKHIQEWAALARVLPTLTRVGSTVGKVVSNPITQTAVTASSFLPSGKKQIIKKRNVIRQPRMITNEIKNINCCQKYSEVKTVLNEAGFFKSIRVPVKMGLRKLRKSPIGKFVSKNPALTMGGITAGASALQGSGVKQAAMDGAMTGGMMKMASLAR